jgi:amino acid adenylation domain-containing protein
VSTAERLQRLRRLSPERRALLVSALRRERSPEGGGDVLPRRSRGTPAPLSFAQQRLWFLDQLVPGRSTYNVAFGADLRGALSLAALRGALRGVAARHEVLRTRFDVAEDGRPVQHVRPEARLDAPLVDLGGLPPGRRRAAADLLAGGLARRPFDLAGGDTSATLLIRLSHRHHLLAVCFHHAIFDGGSQAVFLGEMATLYGALADGGEPLLPPLPVQYGDYAAWQRRRLAGETLERLVDHWRRRLEGAPPLLELPTDRPRPAVQSGSGARHGFLLPAVLADAVQRVAREHDATLFMVLLAGFAAFLARQSQQRELVIGTPVAGRNRDELEGLIGCFVNTLPLRLAVPGAASFADLVAAARAAVLDAFDHQELPLELLIDDLRLERELSRSPLFQAVLVLHEASGGASRRGGLDLDLVALQTGTAKFDLTLAVTDAGGDLAAALEYDRALFDASTVQRFAVSFEGLLAAAVADPRRRLAELPVLTAAQRHAVLLEWNGQLAPRPGDTLHRMFAQQARRRPDAVALSWDGGCASFGELERQAERLARRLRARGVGPEVRVALLLDRTPELVVSALAILVAGGAYVPLDPAHPAERLRFTIEDAAAPLVVTSRRFAALLPPTVPALLLDEPDAGAGEPPAPGARPTSVGRPASDASAAVPAEAAAYVIYTSGSSGRPKGVVVSHAHVARLFTATERRFGFGPGDVWTLFHSFAFDFSVWELWGALLYGGRLHLVPYLTSRDPDAFLRLLADEDVTVLNQTPSAFRQLVRAEGEAGAPPLVALRRVVFGGEALDLPSLRPWVERHGDRRPLLVNMYGITETTVHVTYREVAAGDVEHARPSLIGGPLDDLRLVLLDSAGGLAAIGAVGEIHVGGAGPARGYLGRPGLTGERFVPDPYSGEPGGRLYRSGDLARRLPSGDLQYLGRLDDQVKVRGHRIELGEVEAAVSAHPDVGEAVVVSRPDGEQVRLIAYYAGPEGRAPGPEELREHLRSRLPEPMVPALLVRLPALPLTANGKVDRRALPAPGRDRPDLGSAYAPPRSALERRLAALWAEVLDLERVGVHDNFFALGGDSIRSMRLLARARAEGLELSLQQLFRLQTIASLAAEAESAARPAAGESVPAVEPFALLRPADRSRLPDGLEDAYPLTEMQAGMLYHMELTPDEPLYHNVDSWYLRAPLAVELLREALQRAVDRHEVLRTGYDLAAFSEPLQLVHRRATVELAAGDLSSLPEAEQEAAIDELVRHEKVRPCDLARPPLLRFHVHRRGADRFQLTMAENHAVWDGWSLHATLAEVFADYFALLRGEELPPRPRLGLRYRHFVALERRALASEESGSFFDRLLAGSTATRLPRDRAASSSVPAPRVGLLRQPFDEPLREALRRAAAALDLPVRALLLAAHLKVLSVASGVRDVVTGVVTHGRPEHAEGDELRGLFLNTLPLRVEIAAGTWAELAHRAFAADGALQDHRRYPLAALQRRRGGAPPFEAVFNYIRFHAVEALLASGQVEELGFKKAEGTDRTLLIHFDPAGLQVEYDRGEIADAAAERLADRYRAAVAAIAADPRGRHDEVEWLSDDERRQVAQWSRRDELVGWREPVSRRIAERALATPDAVAVVCGEAHLSFAEAAARARRLAHELAGRGVGPGAVVALHLERSLDLLVAALGTWWAGAAYLPLDPAYPAERRAYVLADAGAAALVTHAAAPPAPAEWGGPTVSLDALPETARVPPVPAAAADDLAYLIYTSGSTGLPKGVEVSHGALANFLGSMAVEAGIGDDDALVAVTSPAFDIAGLELFLPPAVGARLVVAERAETSDGALLASLLARSGATVLQATPATWRLLLAAGWPGDPALSALCGGEALTPALAADLAPRCRRLWNLYGPTETTIWSTAGVVAAVDAVDVGRPIARTSVSLLDAASRAVPPGVAGEVWIGGQGVARGYRGRPGLTADRFRPDPLSESPGGRMYRTGDLGRWRHDGRLELAGRVDDQIKVRGVRIEPGEVEAALEALPEVAEAVVVARPLAGEPALVAYLVAAAGAAPEPAALRQALADRLPETLVPAVFVVLPELPRTPNGKVDRGSLPAPQGRVASRRRVAPRNQVESLVAGVWAEVLEIEEPGVEDRFLDLGGHSLLATRVIARLRHLAGVDLPLASLFEEATVAGLARRLEAALAAPTASDEPALEPLPPAVAAPLSFAQQRLWVLDRLQPGDPSYHVPVRLRVRGSVAPGALAAALTALADRHAVLRTVFAETATEPVQRVLPATPVPLPVVDLAALPPDRLDALLSRLAEAEGARPFDLGRGPLFRASLVRLADEDHALLVTLHHVAGDGWSVEVLVRELAELYRAIAAGRRPDLPPLPVQYADFAAWQRRRLGGDAMAREVAHWRARLDGLEPLELPTDRPRPPVQRHRGAVAAGVLAAPLAGRLRELARREGATLFMTLLAGLDVVLARWSGREEVAVGTPVAGRRRREVEGLIGVFVNVLVLRTGVAGALAFRDLLARVRADVLDALSHQDVPFETLLEALAPERDLSRTPLFQVFFNMLNYAPARVRLPDLAIEPLDVPEAVSKFDLTVYAAEVGEEIHLTLVYDRDLFLAERMEELLAQLTGVLAVVVEDPLAPVAGLSLVTADAARRLPDPVAALGAPWPGPAATLFSEWARRAPGRPALADRDGTWSYGDLDDAVGRLAGRLVAAGVGRGDRVAVYAHRGAALVWALLGVLRTGAAYVVLDPAYPPSRLARFVDLARPAALLHVEAAGALPEAVTTAAALPPVAVVGLPEGGPAAARAAVAAWSAPPPPDLAADDLAYLAFTSGSTGEPRAVAGRHGPLSQAFPWHARVFALGPDDRFSMLSGLGHDPLQRDVFLPLALGASIAVPDPERMDEPGWLAEWMERQAVTVAHLTPAMAKVLAVRPEGRPATVLSRLRWARFVGEELTLRDVERLRRLAPAVRCANFYGTTETQSALSWFAVDAAGGDGPAVAPLGRGIDGVQLLVRNVTGALAGVGEVGELVVRSPHLAAGYWQDAPLTALRFVPDPYAASPGGRVYRTGDRGRYLPSGDVAFAGRADRQVNVRGFRIEPAEIEGELERLEGVREAAVAVRDGRLVAWVAVAAPFEERTLRRALAVRLPGHMVPSRIAALDALPRNAHGKLDRDSLPSPEVVASAPSSPPATESEELLAAVWSAVLGRESIGAEDNFFALGGDSIGAIQVAARAASLGLSLDARDVFQHQTVRELAAAATRATAARPVLPPAPLLAAAEREAVARLAAAAEVEDAFPLTPVQEGILFHSRLSDDLVYLEQLAVGLAGDLDVGALARAWRLLLGRHAAFRTAFHWRGSDRPFQVVFRDVDAPLRVIDVTALSEARRRHELARFRRADRRRTFDPAAPPLVRLALLIAGGEHHLVWSRHHLVMDGWSMVLAVDELLSDYRALIRGEAPRRREAPAGMRDYVAWLAGREAATGEAFWRGELAGFREPTPLPEERWPAVELPPEAINGQCALSLGGETTEALHRLSRSRRLTLGTLMQGVLSLALARYGRTREVVSGLVAACRPPELSGIERAVGVFINTLPIRLAVDEGARAGDWLAEVQRRSLAVRRDEHVSLARLHELAELPPRVPLFSTLLVLESFPSGPDRSAEEGAPTITDVDSRHRTNYPLSVVVGSEGVISLLVRYDRRRIDDAGAARLLRHLGTLAAALSATPDARLADLPWLTIAERHQLLAEWNDTELPRRDETLDRLVVMQATSRPEAVALVFADAHLSFGEMERRSGSLAQRLVAAGCGPDRAVAVYLERSLELPVALVAILRAGGAWVPLDPDSPPERLTFMIDDCGAPLVVTERRHADRFAGAGRRRLLVDDGADVPMPAPSSAALADQLAYTIYTSGSTGRPKGAMNSHRAIVNRLRWMQEAYGLTGGDRVLQKTPVGFDVSVWELFWPLLAGACLVVAAPGGHRDPAYLAALVRREGITVVHFVPSMLRAFLQAPGLEECSSLRLVVASGEALPADLRDAFFARSAARLENLYGPTEAAVDVTRWPCRSADRRAVVPIGRPIANLAAHVLDGRGEPVPVGVPGEVHLGGVGLARGYGRRPALTAERFVPDPHGAPGARLYRTGDLGRRLADGSIEYLGRLDFQVKIRGLRIELGEIEAALTAHRAVSEAVVVADRGAAGELAEPRLVAYLVARAPGPAPVAELREHLGRRLPTYMVPAVFVTLQALPLNASGKLDRRALPVPEPAATTAASSRPPGDPLEKYLAGLWAESLGLPAVGVDDDYFALGGSSLAGALVVNRIQESLGAIVQVVAIFDAPTVGAMARYLVERYPRQVAGRWGVGAAGRVAGARGVDEETIERLVRLLPPLPPLAAAEPNPPAVFVLAPPRSGSTLLRVMLAGSSRLFAPPELELLSFDRLGDRAAVLAGREAYRREGLVRALMEIDGGTAAEAEARMRELEARDLPVAETYRRLQDRVAPRRLVDKTPSYAFDGAVLERAETMFHQPLYVHLLRHPCGMIQSFEEARADEVFFRHDHGLGTAELAEALWTLAHRNILGFLTEIPANRRITLRFEDLVADPRAVLGRLSAFLGVPFEESMADPYRDRGGRMTDGVHAGTRMMGDVKFHSHRQIDASVADRWRSSRDETALSAAAREVAERLGYLHSASPAATATPSPDAAAVAVAPQPLSPAQESLWFLDRLDPTSTAYHLGTAVELTGELDRSLLAGALRRVIARHAVLRTCFRDGESGPLAEVDPIDARPLPMAVVDLSTLGAMRREPESERVKVAEAARPLDLGGGWPVRLGLLCLEARRHVALITVHHIAADGWSLGVLLRELAGFYGAARQGRPVAIAPLPLQYGDFAAGQRRLLAAGRLAEQQAWWRRRLAGAPRLRLPLDRPRSAAPRFRGASVRAQLAAETLAGADAAGRRHGATRFMVALAAYQALLASLAGQDDFLVGVDVAGRGSRELEGLIGLFSKLMPLRADLAGDPSFDELLARVRTTVREALERQDAPLDRLAAEAGEDHERPGIVPLFPAKLNYQNRSPRPLDVPQLDVRPVDRGRRASQADLTLNLLDRGDTINAALEYDADLLTPATAAAWLSRYERLLGLAVSQPARPLSELSRRIEHAERRERATAVRGASPAGGFPGRRRRRLPLA